MQDGRREAIHNPPQGKATQGGEQHGYQPSEKWTNLTIANRKKGEGEAEDKGGVQAGHETSDKLLFHWDWIRRERSKKLVAIVDCKAGWTAILWRIYDIYDETRKGGNVKLSVVSPKHICGCVDKYIWFQGH